MQIFRLYNFGSAPASTRPAARHLRDKAATKTAVKVLKRELFRKYRPACATRTSKAACRRRRGHRQGAPTHGPTRALERRTERPHLQGDVGLCRAAGDDWVVRPNENQVLTRPASGNPDFKTSFYKKEQNPPYPSGTRSELKLLKIGFTYSLLKRCMKRTAAANSANRFRFTAKTNENIFQVSSLTFGNSFTGSDNRTKFYINVPRDERRRNICTSLKLTFDLSDLRFALLQLDWNDPTWLFRGFRNKQIIASRLILDVSAT